MVIRNDRPTTPKPTPPSTPSPPTTGPGDLSGTSGVDDDLDAAGVTDIEKLAGQSLTDGMSASPLATGARMGSAPVAPAVVTSAKTSEPGAITALLEGALGTLKPGEAARIGGKLEVDVEVVAEAGVELEITRRDDGGYDVKVTREGEVGLGGKAALGKADGVELGAGAKATIATSNEITFRATTLDEAVRFGAEVVGAATLGGAIFPAGADIAVKGVVMLESDKVSSTKWAIGGAVAVELEGALDESLKASLEMAGKVSHGVVFVAPDSYFLEMEAEGTFEGGAALGTDAFSVDAPGLGVEGKATIRIPLKGFDPLKGAGALIEQARANLEKATVTVEGKVTSESLAGDIPVVATKTVPLGRFSSMFDDAGWDVAATIDVGPRITAGIGVAEAEIAAQRTVILYEHKGGSLEAETSALAARQPELSRMAERADPSRLKRP